MASLKEVAKASGVSAATVSSVLNNRVLRIHPETRERVLQTARDLNYRPRTSSHVRKPRLKKNIGVLYPHYCGCRLAQQAYFRFLLDGILYYLFEHQWNALLSARVGWQNVTQSLHSHHESCDGLICIGPEEGSDLVTSLLEGSMPFVLINAGRHHPGISCVDVDSCAAAEAMTRYLLDQGHRRIAFLPGQSDHDSTLQRIDGFLLALSDAGLTCPPDWIPPGLYEEASGYHRTYRLLLGLAAHQRPTAIFAANDEIAQGAYRAIRELRLSIPEDISVVGFDDQEFAAQMDPPLTTMRQPLPLLGERAAAILMAQIETSATQGTRPVQKEIVPTQLIQRGSVAPPPQT